MRALTHLRIPTLALGVTLCLPANAADLLDIYRAAVENDPVFMAAEFQRQAAYEAVPQARADLLPQVELGANIARNDVNDDTLGSYQSSGFGVTVTQSIYRRSNHIALSQAEMQVEQADADFASAKHNLLLRSAQNYFNILAARDSLEFARSEKNAIARQLEQAERRYEVGLIAVTDVKEAQARHDIAVAQEIAAENQLAAAKESLRVLIGTAPPDIEPLKDDAPLDPPQPANAEAWVGIASSNNLSLHNARLDVEIARKSIALQRSTRLPALDLIGSYDDMESDGLTGDREGGQLLVQVTVPLYTGGAISSLVRQARANFEQAQARLDSEKRNAEQQTRDAYRNVLADISRANALKQALLSTQSGAEATQAGFDVGTRTAVEVLTALRETFSAQADYSRARYDFILNTLSLRQAAGTLEIADLETVNRWLGDE